MMTLNGLYRLANWNPQFFREIKGRLTPRVMITTEIAAIAAQVLLVGFFVLMLPGEVGSGNTAYCLDFQPDGGPCAAINWPQWWSGILQVLVWIVPVILHVGGVYQIVGDLSKEEKTGTLNFIRLTPQTSQEILLGKLLGVPIVPILVGLSTVPLQLVAAIAAQVPVTEILGMYLWTIATCAFSYTAAILYVFLGGRQAWVGAVAAWFLFGSTGNLLMGISMLRSDNPFSVVRWFGLPIGAYLPLLIAFMATSMSLCVACLWRGINRRFRNPSITLVSKTQSYWMSAGANLWILGFVTPTPDIHAPLGIGSVIFISTFFWFAVLIPMILPPRQTLLDWARYHTQMMAERGQNRAALTDWLFGQKSPATLAILMNVAIVAGIQSLWVLTWPRQHFQGLSAVIVTSLFVLLCAAIGQLISLIISPKQSALAFLVLAVTVMVIQPALLAALSVSPHETALLWMFTAFSMTAIDHVSLTTLVLSVLGYTVMITGLMRSFARQLQKMGASEMQQLMARRVAVS